jgi:hypothetical protein
LATTYFAGKELRVARPKYSKEFQQAAVERCGIVKTSPSWRWNWEYRGDSYTAGVMS